MSGRHGKLSGSPFHVITKRDLASEQYSCTYNEKLPECPFRKKLICSLPQSKYSYKKRCSHFKCKHLSNANNKTQKRANCVYAYKNRCLLHSCLNNCNKHNDMAYCCDYFLPIIGNEQLTASVRNKYDAHEMIKSTRTLMQRHKKSRDASKRNQLKELIIANSIVLRENPEFKNIIYKELSEKISTKFGLEKRDLLLLRCNGITTYFDFVKLSPNLIPKFRSPKNIQLTNSTIKRLVLIHKKIEIFFFLIKFQE